MKRHRFCMLCVPFILFPGRWTYNWGASKCEGGGGGEGGGERGGAF